MENKTVGRPLKIAKHEQLQALANEYFEATPMERVTITGLCIHLDIVRDTLCSYEKNPEFVDTVKKIKLRVEHSYEMRGVLGISPSSFTIFALKNMGWRDKIEQDLSVASTTPFQDILAMIDGKSRREFNPDPATSSWRDQIKKQPEHQ